MNARPEGIGPPGDRYAMWDAAYVLGSLCATERREFEAHMAGCRSCRDAVADLSGVPALLSRLDREEVATLGESGPMATPGVSPALLPSLLAAVRFRRRRARVATWAAASAAAVVLGVGVLVGVHGHSAAPPQQVSASSQPMAQVGTTLLTSTVRVSGRHWGTSINLDCVCLAPLTAHHDTLAMVVVGRDGRQTRLATWVAVPGQTATPAGSISTPVDQIAAVQVVSADNGQVLLQRSL
ncbi:anti-sigma factor family protein [Mycobacterium servetii]|uniref:Anti-sigma factor n=1 Tax=Mycobacterium servetii TaxID=3237418 RepID=A0ABV4C624_9MYCO